MNQFVLAFPIPVSAAETFQITETVQVTSETKTLLVPGCNVAFNVVRNAPAQGLSGIFGEHQEISAEDASAIDAHKSMLFLLGSLKNVDELNMVNGAVLKILAAGALGVYMQQSGSAWTAGAFRELLGDSEFPMDPWINFVESADMLYTLGLEVFGLPDLCIAKAGGEADELRDVLLVVADSIFADGVSSKSGTEVDGGECGQFVLRAETKSPFAKTDPEFNKQGIMRLARK